MEISDSTPEYAQPAPEIKRILAVDDEPSIVRLIQKNLELQGYQVETANNGVQALGKIKANPPHLVITDVMMPEIDGFVLMSKIRSDNALADLPIILMALRPDHGSLTAETITHCKSQGADEVLGKPFTPQDLAAVVNKILLGTPAKDKP